MRALAAGAVLVGGVLPLMVIGVGTANAVPASQTDLQMRVVSRGPVPGEDRYRITVELANLGPGNLTEQLRFRTEFTTVVASSTGTTTTTTINTDARPRPTLLAVRAVDIVSFRFDAPNACRNIGCRALIQLTNAQGQVITDLNPNNNTVEVVDGRIVRG